MKIRYILILSLLFSQVNGQTLSDPLIVVGDEYQEKWVDSVYSSMNLVQKVGQLFVVQAFSNKGVSHSKKISNEIINNAIGGLIFSNGSPKKQINLTNSYQELSNIPLLIGMDAEWGLSMRLDSTFSFPWNMTLGAIKDNMLIKQVGSRIAAHCKRIGVNFNFAPVVDINTNPNNPIIGNRSFGESIENVSLKSLNFMKGQQEMNVLSSAKHFPGHGDTSTDSHKTLPIIKHKKERILNVELKPFINLINNGLESVMIAHLEVPSLEKTIGLPSTLSYSIVTELLKNDLGFKGLIITDALEMKGLSSFKSTGNLDMLAFKAGNDILLMSENVSEGVNSIIDEYNKGSISEIRLSHSVKKILKAKYKVGLNKSSVISTINLDNDLNNISDKILNEQLVERSLTVVKNKENIIPITDLKKKIGYMSFGNDSAVSFFSHLNKYSKVDEIVNINLKNSDSIISKYNTIIIGVHANSKTPWNSYKINKKEIDLINHIAKKVDVILNVFGSPYTLKPFKSIRSIKGVIVSYQNSIIFQQKSAQLIFGALNSKGRLPVSIGKLFDVGDGIKIKHINRLSYGTPESVSMSSIKLRKIDSLANIAIDSAMTPGLQLLIAKDGRVVYNKNFGYLTYDKKSKVKNNTIYDLASLTKILVTLPIVMKLVETGTINLDTKLKEILPSYVDSNKSNITIKEMLSHYSNLKSWIPFYKSTLDSITKKPKNLYYNSVYSNKHNIKVSENLYLLSSYKDSINSLIKNSELNKEKYRYSDLPYYILKLYIEDYYSNDLSSLINSQLFNEIGMPKASYYPKEITSTNNIAPTEIDNYFRFGEIRGTVHDMGAAMQGGIGGHAGLFSNANDIAKIMQMYLQGGQYGNKKYFNKSTIDLFNKCYYCEDDNRRGVGFDKPQIEGDGPTCGCISMQSFGHSGWTGTYTWADPEEKIVYVFLSNRSYPESKENKLLKYNIRTDIQKLIYESIIK
jgi:beta-glucosidase-like glycosyl hydrolase/CubicO group peptidase (beta-lactamase class C family)|tara:strand:+ start:1760 stop:4669 length:2910 start_codon:yes stop_codon:yes gene_type:complete